MTRWRLAFRICCLLAVCVLFQTAFSVHHSYAQTKKTILKLTIIPHRSNLGNERAYDAFIKHLEDETGFIFQWIGSKSYDAVIDKLRTKEADIGYVGPFAYVDAQDRFGVRLICRTLSKKSVEFYHSMIITRKDSGSKTLHDLKGKSFSFTDPKSTSGYLFPMAQLSKAGITQADFSEVTFVKRHANSLLAVFHGNSHAGATSYTAIDKVDIDFDQIRILWKSDPIYRGPWIAQKDMPDDQFITIQKAMLAISRFKNADEIFAGLTTKGFVKGKDSDYDNVREVARLMKLEQ